MKRTLAASTLLFATTLAFGGTWSTLAPVLQARQEVAVAELNGKIYLIGGFANEVLSSVEVYDPATNLWAFTAPLPEPLHHSAAAGVNGALYVIGGYTNLSFEPTDAVYRYDPRFDQWTRVASLPARRGALTAAVIHGRIYAVGGAVTGELNVYDPLTDRWSARAPMPTAREHLASASIDGKLYVAGGRAGGNKSNLEIFDPETNRWTIGAPMPTARSGIAAAAIGGRMYVFGGEGNPASPFGVFSENESYDPATNTWRTEQPMLSPRHGIGAAVLSERIHIPAGAPVQGFGSTNTHDAFDPRRAVRRRPVRRP